MRLNRFHQTQKLSSSLLRSRGFSLLEMILVVAIMTLLGGAIAGILQGSISSASALSETSQRQTQVQAFIQLLQSTFRNLGTQTTMMAQKNPIVDQTNLFIMFNRSNQLFRWHRDQVEYPGKILTWWPSDKGLFTIGILEYNRLFRLVSGAQSSPNFSAGGWKNKIDLLTDVKKVEWRFWSERAQKWSIDWRNPSERPQSIELSLQLGESTETTLHYFWIPNLQLPPINLSGEGS